MLGYQVVIRLRRPHELLSHNLSSEVHNMNVQSHFGKAIKSNPTLYTTELQKCPPNNEQVCGFLSPHSTKLTRNYPEKEGKKKKKDRDTQSTHSFSCGYTLYAVSVAFLIRNKATLRFKKFLDRLDLLLVH